MTLDHPPVGRLEGPEHLLPARVYYEDTDFTGVVYHANYLRYFERGRSEFLRVMGPVEGMGEDPGAFAVVHISIDFKAPARIHDALLIRTVFAGMRGPRLIFRQRAERDGVLLCEAEVIAVPIQADGRVRRPSAAELAHWDRHKKPAATE
ncbi:MAG: YbgC/FadM family acyl-CoA thioesterase [Alphaproteobacteria bacterium]|nr:YbgC/FadM family acyl-CoA thioesterase [Alphaproteobacteria bacterium]